MRTRWTRSAALLAVSLSALVSGQIGGAPVVSARPAARTQSSPSTSTPAPGTASSGTPSTVDDLLKGPVTTVTATTVPKAGSSPSKRVADDNRRVWLVVTGLVTVAVLLALLTAWYWMRTRPANVVAAIGPPPRDERRPPAGTGGPGRSDESSRVTNGVARETLTGADGRMSDGLLRNERVEHAAPRRPARPRREQREAALRRARGLSR